MDSLVAQYSRPAYQQQEPFLENEQDELSESVPGLSLKFAMPPIAHVSSLQLRSTSSQPPRPASSPFATPKHIIIIITPILSPS
jgi:hypothetical protein